MKLVIGASVSSTIGASFKLLEARIRQLRQLSSEGKGDLYPLGHETLGNGCSTALLVIRQARELKQRPGASYRLLKHRAPGTG
ncbi:hypothetical protein NWF32_17455 [Pseudomonas qingdaonensis]|nr:hypothetical protein [Pseudomonas qingdaonensis]